MDKLKEEIEGVIALNKRRTETEYRQGVIDALGYVLDVIEVIERENNDRN